MIGDIVPAGVAVADSFGDLPDARLLPEEEAGVRSAIDRRRREYTTVRHLARRAMRDLGIPVVPILSGARREPLWPSGVVGSMTHCAGYRAAALGFDAHHASIGIDAEPHAPLPEGLLTKVAHPDEVPHLARLAAARPEVHWDRLLFSAKEAVYKAWYPLARRWLGFQEARLTFDPASDGFTAELRQTGPVVAGAPLTRMSGRWHVRGGLVVAAVTIGQAPSETEAAARGR
ncbi:4'-phosphopantetheinyl transferase superfamily protein [Streptomyces sp. 71268]|uniref:4'-phosphopantetheinyl transferase family protein n=1 Tax=Streptomyces sp. 71268 TaxID=3002640 RepID=UPI0023F82FBE|nr:4'-phosphopantetheinyl transferase superfamily protein [Streptomyces sp. 71268]WEV23842.1 4'-phosphopantetheinyl transferase superfamily protein [Streptomyces sp. 71268]